MSKITLTQLSTIIISAIIFCASCANSLPPEALSATKEAVSALQKLNAATDVGINQVEYGKLLIDAQAKVNQASSKLKDGELKTEIKSAMECYVDAKSLWTEKKTEEALFIGPTEINETDNDFSKVLKQKVFNKVATELHKKYEFQPHQTGGEKSDLFDKLPKIMVNEALTKIWKKAGEHTQRAENLIPK